LQADGGNLFTANSANNRFTTEHTKMVRGEKSRAFWLFK
jgi:hypothetical protein